MTRTLRNPLVLASLVLILANIFFFRPFYLERFLPFPGNLLVTYYFPWNSGEFPDFDPWTTRKGVIAMDVVRAMYPWRSLVVEQLRQFQWPFWNPYNFSGTPLLANIQSSVLFPTTLLLTLFPLLPAWVFSVIFLPLLFSFFWFLFFRSLKLALPAALFGAVAAANLTYLNVWSEQLVIIQSALFLPLALWAVNKFRDTANFRYLLLTPLLLAFSLFGGHPQTVLYVYLLVFLYLLFNRVSWPKLLVIGGLTAGLSAIQLLPTLELYSYSAREAANLREFTATTTLPWANLATVFAPDFFGNPAVGNFRGRNYDNFLASPGIVALILAAIVACKKISPPAVKFFAGISLGGLILSLAPFAYIFTVFHIPILSSGHLSRIIFFFELGIAVLAAYGFDYLLKKKDSSIRPTVAPILFTAAAYSFLAAVTFFLPAADRAVSQRNLLLPALLFSLSSLIILLRLRFPRLAPALVLLIFLGIIEYSYFFVKYQPFAVEKFVFPSHPVFTFLQTQAGFNRFLGQNSAYVDNNFATFYRVFAVEGYDPLFIRRYGELLASSETGTLPAVIPPMDAYIGKTNNPRRERLMDVLGIKYSLDDTDEPDRGPGLGRVGPSWKFYERRTALPRAFLAGSYELETDPGKTILKFYQETFAPERVILLEEKPKILPRPGGTTEASITRYNSNQVEIITNSSDAKLLFLSDNYYPGWKAYVDGRPEKILRADYTFRAVPLPAGKHNVVFRFEPEIFSAGLYISLASFALWLIALRRTNR